MIKRLLVSVCLLVCVLGFAQEGSYSPYSFYGLGEQRFKGTIENRSMGGLSIFPDSIHVNIQNPASFSSLKLTTFSLGGTTSVAGLRTESQKEQAKRTGLDYFTLALPIAKKVGFAFGLMPQTSVGYKVQSVRAESLDNGASIDTTRSSFNGTGGMNRVFGGFGYEISKNFRVGASFNYYFGEIATTSLQEVYGVQLSTQERNVSDVSGVSLEAGLMYEGKIKDKYRIFAGVSYAPEAKLNMETRRNITTIQRLVSGNSEQQTVDFPVQDEEAILPSRFTLGGGFGKPMRWQAGAEVTLTQGKEQNNRYQNMGNAAFENGIRYSVGGYFIPNHNSFTSYFKRITYRAGMRYEKTGLVLQNQSITDTAVNFGMGFPIPGGFSNINLGLEYGKRGTVAYGLVEENYFNVSIGFSFNDRWFVKRKYD